MISKKTQKDSSANIPNNKQDPRQGTTDDRKFLVIETMPKEAREEAGGIVSEKIVNKDSVPDMKIKKGPKVSKIKNKEKKKGLLSGLIGGDKEQTGYEKGVSTLRDLLAPSALKIESQYIQIGKKYIGVLFILNYPRYLHSAWLAPIINLDRVFDVSIFVHPMESDVILKNLQKKLARVQSQMNDLGDQGRVRDPKLETAYGDIEELRDRLQTGQEKFFEAGVYFAIHADDKKELDEAIAEIKGILESQLIYAKPAMFTQENGYNSVLPLADDKLQTLTSLNTQPLSTIFPFVSSDLSSNQGILYGINRHNNSLILFDRFNLENANTVIFGTSGSGKSYSVKLEVLRQLMTGTDVIIIDPENEYQYLAETVGGTYVKISLSSPYHINPFDVPTPAKDEDPSNVLRSHFGTVTGMLKMLLGGASAEEESILDKAVIETYASRDIRPDSDFINKKITAPKLEDLQEILEGMDGAKNLATRLEKYTRGTFSQFLNNHTNIDVKNGLMVFSIRDLEDELRPIAMYVILNYIWRMVRTQMKKRLLIVDEAWWMMKYKEGAEFLFGIAKRARKYYLGLTTITQDVADFSNSEYGRPIITNSSLQILLKQSTATIDDVARLFNLTQEERYLLLEAEVGGGLFFAGLKHVAIKIVASYSEDQIITSDPKQLLEIEEAKKELG
jgi:conjugal transfer ATP-binding protein TraC